MSTEWRRAWPHMRFGHAYPVLQPVDLDAHKLALYRYAQVLSLTESPLRLAETDFPDRAAETDFPDCRWMLDLAERNVVKALAVV
ncbi:hypothetical protein [Couchioplanes caeruleus]|uniref:Uncharacterized protein n=1 Tax=Couchioplanes caeruleus subsp. caeruleus TaxID=56427 RepID=A0A1K0FM02_9ACTN|nr:hypothetical protein [Couchioplanes caeruleus]OJF13760.1 hypothetical protein BG844_13375 [Couchioplanes caeruleus subsp. caeruleus]